ncbi:MAG: hypothetical protein HY023_07815, partial [Chloroflexi bacterium]|nr:hypothetical protein [Chloroflexota bacterium]
MDTDQLRKTVEWLDEERRKDKADTAILQERLIAMQAENAAQANRIQRLEAEWSASNAMIQRIGRMDEMLDNLRGEVTRQIAAAEQRRVEAERESERLRQIEREGQNRTVADLRKSVESLPRVEQDMAGRKEEEKRVAKILLDLRKKIG